MHLKNTPSLLCSLLALGVTLMTSMPSMVMAMKPGKGFVFSFVELAR
jgi:hypothetical protein